MRELRIKLPEKIELDSDDVKKFLAAKLYESGKLTLGQAAEMAGLTKTTFSEMLAHYGVSLINYPPSDINRDAAATR